jgi:uncharacterized protein (TIGR03083 family)
VDVDALSRTTANRLLLADFFDGLDEGQLATPSLCGAWSVRDVLGHIAASVTGGIGGLLVAVVRERGSVDGANARLAREAARRPVAELTAVLRDRADQHGRAPGVGPVGPLADTCVHLRDCARPLGLDADATLGDWRLLLEAFANGVPGLVPKKRLDGLALRAVDQEWWRGQGPEVSGSSEALAMAAAGRGVALRDLEGPGVVVLADRLGQA